MGTHVLVVDDEPDFVEFITHGLQTKGIECSAAPNGMAGLDQARRIRPQAVVLDVMLPDLDGFTICEMLRRKPFDARMAVVMMTCLGGTLTRANGISSGADDYLVKPLKIPLLIERIRWAIGRRADVAAGRTSPQCV